MKFILPSHSHYRKFIKESRGSKYISYAQRSLDEIKRDSAQTHLLHAPQFNWSWKDSCTNPINVKLSFIWDQPILALHVYMSLEFMYLFLHIFPLLLVDHLDQGIRWHPPASPICTRFHLENWTGSLTRHGWIYYVLFFFFFCLITFDWVEFLTFLMQPSLPPSRSSSPSNSIFTLSATSTAFPNLSVTCNIPPHS